MNFIRYFSGKSSVLSGAASQVVMSLATFLSSIVILQATSLEVFGQYSLLFLVLMVGRKLHHAAVLTPYTILRSKRRNQKVFDSISAMYAAFFAFFLSLGFAFFLYVWWRIDGAEWMYSAIWFFFAASFFFIVVDFWKRAFFDGRYYWHSFFLETIRSGGFLACLVVACFWKEIILTEILCALLISSIVSSVYAVVLLRPRISGLDFRWSRATIGRFLHFAKWLIPSVALESFQSFYPVMLSGSILGESSVGVLRAMQQLANVLNLPFNTLQQVAPTIAASRFNSHGARHMNSFLYGITGVSVLGVLLMMGLIFILKDFVIKDVMNINDADSVSIFLIYSVVNILILIRLPVLISFQTVQKLKIIFFSNMVGAVLALLVANLAIQWAGAVGVPLVGVLVTMFCILYFCVSAILRDD